MEISHLEELDSVMILRLNNQEKSFKGVFQWTLRIFSYRNWRNSIVRTDSQAGRTCRAGSKSQLPWIPVCPLQFLVGLKLEEEKCLRSQASFVQNWKETECLQQKTLGKKCAGLVAYLIYSWVHKKENYVSWLGYNKWTNQNSHYSSRQLVSKGRERELSWGSDPIQNIWSKTPQDI